MNQIPKNRWIIAIMGTLLQIALGTVYSWSYFQKPIVTMFHWSNSQTAWAFSVAICSLGIAAAWGGLNLKKYGPKKLAMIGGGLYGIGFILSSYALTLKSLPLFILTFGVIGGIGLGLGYVTPVATALKWFPDKKGFVSGMVVMGFGLGALFMSKLIAPTLMAMTQNNIIQVFFFTGIVLFIVAVFAASFLKNPPENYYKYFNSGKTQGAKNNVTGETHIELTGELKGQFVLMWLIFFFNITAGIIFIGFQSPMIQELVRKSYMISDGAKLAAIGATLIAVSSIFNGVGRFFWGSLSDKLGRIQTFRLILGTQILIFALLLITSSPWVFGALVCYVLLCYGGGFGSMPSFVSDVFGEKNTPKVYGAMLTAWSIGGIAGPQIAANIKDLYPAHAATYTFTVAMILLIIGLLLSFRIKNKTISA
jgi:OFA family oxalate/formate antiporter-like MFS transporter